MRYSGLLGKSIKYSISPLIHNEYYEKHNLNLEYRIFDIEKNQIEGFICSLEKNNIVGLNVTIPYKEYIITYLDDLDFTAKSIGAVNTIAIKDNKLIGYNTDYYGFLKTLEDINFDIKGSRALILGGGGAAKAVLYALHNSGAATLDLVVRNKETMWEHRDLISNTWSFQKDFQLEEYDIVINCTPIGGANYIEDNPIRIISAKKNTLFYDLNYVPERSIFLQRGEELGCRIINGKDMLFNQAYKAIKIWHENIEEEL
ncbi:shikimate dehydrogenase [Clostridium sp.]|uniref:shikimate dehydrogenase n=1 Tax=Clostridium sp. TaxID=1506 RepID=UPI002FCA1D75